MLKDTENKYRFNIIDFFIIVVIVAIIGIITLAVLGNDIREYTSTKTDISYSLCIIDSSVADCFSVDDEIYMDNGKCAGQIVTTYLQNGKTVLVVKAKAYEIDNVLFIKGQKLVQNESFPLMLEDGTSVGTVCSGILTN